MFDGREQLEEALRLVERPTVDLDVVASVDAAGLEPLERLPPTIQQAVTEVATELGLPFEWLNVGPRELLRLGLPEGFEARLHTRRYGTLRLLLADRYDQIHLKLYAAVDQGPDSKHAQDLLLLNPDPEELTAAARWCQTHDPSDAFADQLRQALAFLRTRLGHA